MRLEAVMAVAAWMGCSVNTSSLNSNYLEGFNWTCKRCLNVPGLKPIGESEDRTCNCDDDCAIYGDCCPDSTHFGFQKQRHDASFVCQPRWLEYSAYMRATCPTDWAEPNVRVACENASKNRQDPMAGLPVTDLNSGVTYRNIFCATCNQAKDFDVWQPKIFCSHLTYHMTDKIREELINSLSFNNKTQDWEVHSESKFHRCFITPEIPETSSKFTRRCFPYDIKTCPTNWTNADVRSKCEDYTSRIYIGFTSYRNPHCALCNNAPLSRLMCPESVRINPSANFGILLDLSDGPPGMTQPCDDDQLYDPFFRRCRRVLDELLKSFPSRTTYLSVIKNTTVSNHTIPIMKCKKFVLNKNDYIIEDKAVYVDKYRKRFREGEFNINESGRLEICSDTIGVKLVGKFEPHMLYITLSGLGVSIIFLLIHLIAYCLVPGMRNLPGNNMASLCVALLTAHTSFVAGRFLQGDACLVVAILAFYYFLASFTWMLTMSFDVWRTIRLSASQLRVSSGKQWYRFIAYSLCSWLVPAFFVLMSFWVEFYLEVGTEWKPSFATNKYCWFGRSKPLLIFFAVPLAIVMLLNIVFFASSVRIVYSSLISRPTASASTQHDFMMYLRLVVMMGLTWTMGLIAGILDFDFLWYLFTLFNTLQGLFIFLAFTCNDSVMSLVYKLR